MTSRKEKSGYSTPNNDIKAVMHSRSGNRIINDDATGDITIESQKGQTIAVIHGDGHIRFKAPKNIEFEAGEDIVMTAGRDITSNAVQDISEIAGINHTSKAGGIMTQSAVGDYNLTAFDINESAVGKRNSHAEIIQEQAGAIQKHATDENINVQGQKKISTNSGENSNFF